MDGFTVNLSRRAGPEDRHGAIPLAVISHGAAIRVWLSRRAANVVPSAGAENRLDHTGIVTPDESVGNGWALRNWAGTPINTDLSNQ